MAAAADLRLKDRLQSLLQDWQAHGIPSPTELQGIFAEINNWKEHSQIKTWWESPPLLLTATLDDGWGHGLQLIELCARTAELRVVSLGLLQSPQTIIGRCRTLLPDLVGVTILQFDSEPDLKWIADHLPTSTRLLAGGPLFRIDPQLAERTGVHCAARNIADFLEFLLNL